MYMNIVCMYVQTFPHNMTDKNKNKEPLGGRKTRYKYEYESAWFGEKRMLLEVSRGVQQGPNKRTTAGKIRIDKGADCGTLLRIMKGCKRF